MWYFVGCFIATWFVFCLLSVFACMFDVVYFVYDAALRVLLCFVCCYCDGFEFGFVIIVLFVCLLSLCFEYCVICWVVEFVCFLVSWILVFG